MHRALGSPNAPCAASTAAKNLISGRAAPLGWSLTPKVSSTARACVATPSDPEAARSQEPLPAETAASASTTTAELDAAEATPGTEEAEVSEPTGSGIRNIVFVSSEVTPYSKTGGLADVVGSLPKALAQRSHKVMVITPRYSPDFDAEDTGLTIDVSGAEVRVYMKTIEGCYYVFLGHSSYERPGGLYADAAGVYGDNQFRFMLLCRAAIEVTLQLKVGNMDFTDECMFVANDWHAALVPVYLAAHYRRHSVHVNSRAVLAIHNMRHQGVYGPKTFSSLGLPDDWERCLDWQYPPEERLGAYEEEGHCVNHLKAGLCTADRILTVSPTYADEIKTSDGGWHMETVLGSRSFHLNGVVNGIDTVEWNPMADPALPASYDVSNYKRGKRACKIALQEELGLPVDGDKPLIAFIGRLDAQKGADHILQAAPEVLARGVQIICLGTGDTALENGLRWMENTWPTQARGWVGFNVDMAHKLTAAADILLMPSRFEPCGLNQLYAMRYGTVVVAHATGGLRDTVLNYDPETGTGTGFAYEDCSVGALMWGINAALDAYWDYPETFQALQENGMRRDSSWDMAASEYEQIFEWAFHDRPYAS